MIKSKRKSIISFTAVVTTLFFSILFSLPGTVHAQTTPLLSTSLEDMTSVANPTNGTGTGSLIHTSPADDFVPAQTGNGIRIDAADEYVRFQQTDGTVQNVELDKGTVEFWYQPFYNHTDGNAYRIFGIGTSNSPGFIGLYKRTAQYGNDLYFYIKDANSVNRQTRVNTSNYSWNIGDWVKLRITWNTTVATGVQNARIYINDQQVPSYAQTNKGPFPMPQESTNQYIFMGVVNSGETQHANGIIDEFQIYNGVYPPSPTPTITPTPLATATPTPTSASTNLLVNPGFESGGTGWTGSTSTGRSIVASPHSGSYAQQIRPSSQAERDVYQDVAVSASENYQISAWIRPSGLAGPGGFVELIWQNSAGDTIQISTLAQLNGSTAWTLFSRVYAPPAGATNLTFRLVTAVEEDNAGKAFFDDTEVIATAQQPTADTQTPTISLLSPVTGSTVSYHIPVTTYTRDNVGIAGVEFKLDGIGIQPEDTSFPFTLSFDTTQFSDGIHALTAFARDTSNNTTTSAPINIIINNTNRPNVVLILTDDQRWDTMQYMPLTNTLLGSQSVKFTNATVSTSLCCPSRSSILTGLYVHNHGVKFTSAPNGGAVSFKDSSTIATWLTATGYRTSLVGKYLNGYSVISPYIPPGWTDWNVTISGEEFYNYSLNENGTIVPYGNAASDYSTDVFTNKAVSFINATPVSQPLFLYVAPIAPHYPYTPAPQDIGLFSGIAPWRPPSFNEADVSDKPQWIQQLPVLTQIQIDLNDSIRQQQLESLQAVDRQVEAIVAALQQTGRLDNTMIIYTSDNGFFWGEHRKIEDKICAYEECGRVPLWVRLPGGSVSRTDDNLVQNIDFAPTIAELAGVPVPATVNGKNVNGISFLTLLTNPQTPWTTEVLYEGWGHYGALTNLHGFSAVRTLQYMYGEYKNGDRELYDLIADPYQLTNVVNDSAQAATVADLQNRLNILKTQ